MQTMSICLKQSKLLTSSVDRDDDGRVAVFPSWLPSAAEAEATAGEAGERGEAGATAGGAGERGEAGVTAGGAGERGEAGMTAGGAREGGEAGIGAADII